MIDITAAVSGAVSTSGVREGVCTVYCPHTTAAVTVNEGADPDVAADILERLAEIAPAGARYCHAEGNADSHIKAALVGPSVSIPIEDGRLALGTWQRVFFCEFDGPRTRGVQIAVNPS
jgi:secondary thiamine-phosphate synthase enzyme